LITQTSISSTLPSEQPQLPLVLQLDQLIELCHQQKIDINKFTNNEASRLKVKFTLLPSQIAHLIHQNNFDIKKLITIEQHLKTQDIQDQQFRLNSSQLAYLFANHRIDQSNEDVGLSVAQFIGLYVLQQQSNEISLTYQQIKQLAQMQSK
jgi:hypothetical protein